MEYKSQIDRSTTKLDVATATTTEYKKQIDVLNTELDVTTNAMLREQEKAQDLQKLNLMLLVISGIGTISIIVIGVRSRLKRAVS